MVVLGLFCIYSVSELLASIIKISTKIERELNIVTTDLQSQSSHLVRVCVHWWSFGPIIGVHMVKLRATFSPPSFTFPIRFPWRIITLVPCGVLDGKCSTISLSKYSYVHIMCPIASFSMQYIWLGP